MSRVTEVTCARVRTALHTPFATAARRTTATESVVLRVTDGDGLTGWGEAPQLWRVTGESLAGAGACLLGPLRDVLLGADPEDLVALTLALGEAVVGNRGAKAAADVAVHDLLARRRGLSLPRLLGTTTHRLATDVTLAAGSAEELAEAARARVAEGFSVLKLKVGADPSGDVERVVAVRRAVGVEVALRLDANQGWTPRRAVRVVTALEDAGAGVELVEQPVRAEDLDGLAWVTHRVATPVMADESVCTLRDLLGLVDRRAADLVNVKLAKCGGIGPARTLLEVAREHGLGTMVGTMMEGPVGVGAAASLAAAYGTTVVCDLDAAWWAGSSPVVGGVRYDGGEVALPDAPGLGVTGLA